ncbi:Fumarylacetoacetate hydrolase domain-containing protein 2 [Eumeta japonica]|uniref:Fumarylacetoacetate hydrolase domain-containing protein 2 n=1 Tax=Eumeta variegata TaxID=151549 RepID=A0A4C1V227_EUMVA|nr:Fumarylacetoacetate hydrolase domain-containing protein 2 [Eumeta japonica]
MVGASHLGRQFVPSLRLFSTIETFSRNKFNNTCYFNSCRRFSKSNNQNMKFIQFAYNNKPEKPCVGLLNGDNVVDLNQADSSLPSSFLEILKNGLLDKVKRMQISSLPTVPLSSVTLAAPIQGMDKVICIGLNYKDHCEEQNLPVPEVPIFFSKFPSCVIGPNDSVMLRTKVTKCVDYEAELTVVIGKKASDVQAEDAYNYVAGYTVAQDISARDWQKQRNGGQFLLGKAMDTFCPIGPCIVTGDELGDPQSLSIQCSLNGVRKQKSNTNQLVHKIPDAIARLSSVMTLYPGDIILTGTPGGVGMYRNPPEYLKPGDLIETEIEKIGVLTTRVEQF